MKYALREGRLDFVELALDLGFEMSQFLTVAELEELYNLQDRDPLPLERALAAFHVNPLPPESGSTAVSFTDTLQACHEVIYSTTAQDEIANYEESITGCREKKPHWVSLRAITQLLNRALGIYEHNFGTDDNVGCSSSS